MLLCCHRSHCPRLAFEVALPRLSQTSLNQMQAAQRLDKGPLPAEGPHWRQQRLAGREAQ